jgi:hypothetical protein
MIATFVAGLIVGIGLSALAYALVDLFVLS